MKSVGSLCVMALAVLCGAARADITLNRSNYPTDAAAGQALATAVTGAAAGETITVGKGRWLLSLAGSPDIKKQNVTLRGATANPRDTVIDGGGVTNCVNVSAANATVCGLTLTNGQMRVTVCYSGGVPCNDEGYGGGVYSRQSGTTVSNCIVTCCRGDINGISYGKSYWNTRHGCGLYLSGGNSLLTDSLVESNVCYVTGAGVGSGDRVLFYGVGAYLAGSGTKVRRSIVRNNGVRYDGAAIGNQQQYSGMGLFINGAVAEQCVISGNRALNLKNATYPSLGGVGGVYVNGAAAVLRDSYVTGNYGYQGGGVHVNQGRVENCDLIRNRCTELLYGKGGNIQSEGAEATPVRITGCRIEGGVTTQDSAAGRFGGYTTVSNSIIRGNRSSVVHVPGHSVTLTHCLFYGNSAGYIIGRDAVKATLVTDCWFECCTNPAAYNAFWAVSTANVATEADAGVIRNSVFYRNVLSGGLGRGTVNGAAPIQNILESCTFVSNSLPNSLYRFSRDGLSYSGVDGQGPQIAPKLLTRNCIFYGNYNGKNRATIWNSAFADSSASILYDFAPGENTAYVTAANGNITDPIDPLLVDVASGNLRLTARSPLRDKGLYEPWMDGATDMGAGFDVTEGVTTFTAFGETHTVGCNLKKRNPARWRVCPHGSEKPDIGACEFENRVGFIILYGGTKNK